MPKLVRHKPQREPTIALINIVFLMLVFFMVAGTLSQPLDTDLKLVRTADLDGRAPPDDLVLHADGRLVYRGRDITDVQNYMAALPKTERTVIRLIPDQSVPAQTLLRLARAFRAAGAGKVMLVTQRALK